MRLIYDLFPSQTASGHRGIGRFTRALARAMACARGGHDMYALSNGAYPESVDALRQLLTGALAPGRFCTYTHPGVSNFEEDRPAHNAVTGALIRHAYSTLIPDAVIYATPFEGWGEQNVAALPGRKRSGSLRVTVLYDLIPWLYPDQYLRGNAGYAEWYKARLDALHDFDLLLAISETTRQDAITILDLPLDRVVNIGGAASAKFCRSDSDEQDLQSVAHFGINRPFVLYTGNADYRKNQKGLLQAYARLPQTLRKTHQLVLNQIGDIQSFKASVRSLGLADEEIVVTGRISDEQLIRLYRSCKLFVFPSLYEGLGLPVLEAMACGAPVIASNNSSLPEIVGRADALFDAADPAAISTAIQRVLADDAFRDDLRQHSLERQKVFSWERTASLAWHAIEQRLECERAEATLPGASPVSIQPESTPPASKPSVAFVCAPGSKGSIADAHCADLLSKLTPYFDIDAFVEEGSESSSWLNGRCRAIYPHTELVSEQNRYATVVYHVVDSERHACMIPLMEQCIGVVILLDSTLRKIAGQILQSTAGEASLANTVIRHCGLQGLLQHLAGNQEIASTALFRQIMQSAHQLLLPEEAGIWLAQAEAQGLWSPPITTIPVGKSELDAAPYLKAIKAAIQFDLKHSAEDMVSSVEHLSHDDRFINMIAVHAANNWSLRKNPRLLIDVTQLSKTDARTGIQRVVRNIARELCHMASLDVGVELVRLEGDRLVRADQVIRSIFSIDTGLAGAQDILVQRGDTLLMLDSSWEQYPAFSQVFDALRNAGGKIVTTVYDLIPLRMPNVCTPNLVAVFERWFGMAVEQSDMLVCISRSVADNARACIDERGFPGSRVKAIGHWPLGADLVVDADQAAVRPEVQELVENKASPLFLMVGTIEPRKNHGFVLDAFDALWETGLDARLCIAGKPGWLMNETMARIRHHPLLNKNLFLIESFSDQEINLCYASASALIAASAEEGFGLPIVEAALHRRPTIASDIPVFHEVGGEGAIYFSLEDNADLAAKIVEVCAMDAATREALAAKIPVMTWRESAQRLAEIVMPETGLDQDASRPAREPGEIPARQ
jgi:glycosyltransferase involved in cell wall biosynthesis